MKKSSGRFLNARTVNQNKILYKVHSNPQAADNEIIFIYKQLYVLEENGLRRKN